MSTHVLISEECRARGARKQRTDAPGDGIVVEVVPARRAVGAARARPLANAHLPGAAGVALVAHGGVVRVERGVLFRRAVRLVRGRGGREQRQGGSAHRSAAQ